MNKFNKSQEKAIKELRNGKNVFLAGSAGTGKTYVLNSYIKECEKKGKNVIVIHYESMQTFLSLPILRVVQYSDSYIGIHFRKLYYYCITTYERL